LVTSHSGIGTKLSEQAALTARLMLYGLVAVVLMAMDHRGQYIPRFRSFANHLVEPVYHVVDWPVNALRSVFGFFQSGQSLRRENQELQIELLEQKGLLQRLEAMAGENQRLRNLLDSTRERRFTFQFAELVEVDLDPFSHRVVIDRGTNDGVAPGQAVIDGSGVMGQVESASLHFSTVRLISDPNHALPVQFNRTGLRSVAFGVGTTDYLSLPTVPLQADVREGDLIVTSGLGDRFPAGYPVATVASIDRREGQTFMQVLAAPLAALDRGREVLLILPVPEKEDQPEASGPGELIEEPGVQANEPDGQTGEQ
jgi:rod shape-determining protein MreC